LECEWRDLSNEEFEGGFTMRKKRLEYAAVYRLTHH
jgi:hypothetical protein